MSGQLRGWLMAWRAFAGNPGLLIQDRTVPTPTGLSAPEGWGLSPQKPCAGGCSADVLLMSPQLVLAGAPVGAGKCPGALPSVSPGQVSLVRRGGPGTQSCPWSSSGREPATGGSAITWGFIHGLNLNGKSREAPVYLLLPFV